MENRVNLHDLSLPNYELFDYVEGSTPDHEIHRYVFNSKNSILLKYIYKKGRAVDPQEENPRIRYYLSMSKNIGKYRNPFGIESQYRNIEIPVSAVKKYRYRKYRSQPW